MMVDRNLLGGSPSLATKCGSKQTMVESSTVGMPNSRMGEIMLPGSQPRSC
jgi:hypothetical protein